MNGKIDQTGVAELSISLPRSKVTATLVSSNPDAKIEISTTNGLTWFEPTYDKGAAGDKMVVFLGPISNMRFTGDEGDPYFYLY